MITGRLTSPLAIPCALAALACAGGCARSTPPGGFDGEQPEGGPSPAAAPRATADAGAGASAAATADATAYGAGPDAATTAASDDASTAASADDASVTGVPTLVSADASESTSCAELKCQVHACPGGGSTTISGVVYDPAAKNPLYDIVVYVPNAPLAPLARGASCASCSALYSGEPIATALTDASGRFTIRDAPDGADIPLVVQIGKWRMQYVIPKVEACTDNAQPDRWLRLPRNGKEGDLPNIAISTGGADSLECLLGRIGVDASEYVAGAGAGHVHVFQGGAANSGAPNTSPPAPASSAALWDSTADLSAYDMVLLSCEGDETTGMNQQALFDYTAAGGRVFASHYHYAWFDSGPFASAASLATWSPGGNSMGDVNATVVTALPNGQPFAKGLALQQWLGQVGALANGELPIQAARHNADVAASNAASQPWLVSDSSSSPPGATQYFTFDTPLGADAGGQCGRVVFSDLHVGAASGDYASGSPIVPANCAANELSPQEKVLEFMLFDLSSCVTPNGQPPQPPQAVR